MNSHDLESIPLPAFIVGSSGALLAANTGFRDVLATNDAVTGVRIQTVLPDEAAPENLLRAAARSAQPVRVQARRLNDVPVSADIFVSNLDSAGTLLCLLREVRDEQLLSESQRWLDVAFETAPIGMALFDTDGQYVRANAALCRMLRRDLGELLGRRDQEFTHADDRQADVDAAWRILNGEIDTLQVEKRFVAPDGDVIWAIANMTFLRDSAGRPLCWLGQFQDITLRKKQESRLQYLADHDELTGVANRRRLLRELELQLRRSDRGHDRGAVIVVDLDGFKLINDAHGHQAGDRALVTTAAALLSRLRAGDLLGRLGGDEFAVVLPEARVEDAETVARALERAVFEAGDGTLRASCGIAMLGHADAAAPEDVLAVADRAMYEAKGTRRGTVGA